MEPLRYIKKIDVSKTTFVKFGKILVKGKIHSFNKISAISPPHSIVGKVTVQVIALKIYIYYQYY